MTDSEQKAASNENTAISQRIRERFDLYLLGLIFTTLALSIQTAKFAGPLVADIAELVSWVCLFTAGLAGLSRLEYIPEIYRLAGLLSNRNDQVAEGERHISSGVTEYVVAGTIGKTLPVADYVERAREDVAKLEEALKPHERTNQIKYRTMKVAFVLGLASLIVARAAGPVDRITAAYRTHPAPTKLAPPAKP